MCKFWYWALVKDEFESHYSNGIDHITRAFQNIWIFGPSRWLSVKNTLANTGHSSSVPGWMIPCRRKWQPTPAFLPRKFLRQRRLVDYSPWGRKVVQHDSATKQQQQHLEYIKNTYKVYEYAFMILVEIFMYVTVLFFLCYLCNETLYVY